MPAVDTSNGCFQAVDKPNDLACAKERHSKTRLWHRSPATKGETAVKVLALLPNANKKVRHWPAEPEKSRQPASYAQAALARLARCETD